MLSRVADNLYWFGRYVQRAENTARLINVHANLLLDLPRNVTVGWAPLLEITGADAAFRAAGGQATEDNVVRFTLMDERNSGSIFSSLNYAREIARVSRDCLPREAWERLNDLYLFVQERGERSVTRARRQDFLQGVINGAMTTVGVLTSNMSRDVGFQFLRMGTNLEQADMTTRILDVRSSRLFQADASLTPFDNIQWMSVLKSLTAYQMYRRHVRARVNGPGVLRFLLQDRQFPRSVSFALATIGSTMPFLPPSRKVERAIERTKALIADANIGSLLSQPDGLALFMDEIQVGLGQLDDAIAESYFRS
ncbi:alpha-E domain-containing protein [Stagnimonas aquatica]|uniref:Alpha-E domain-containing protein n=1 Tax=Stagnimonas aquatica TaxID=2689987 RepID=A0A3N0VKN2_9GAMM|nr:alpha-E domain-containing protein [Stagnimonas aquatica]ROH93260.1 alpha-E domain-containing protein [Stagnimonas aquatica]